MRLISLVLLSLLMLLPEAAMAQTAPTFADCSIASLSGSSQSLGTAFTLGSRAYNRKYLLICNTGSAGNNVGVNLAGGTAALAGAGTLTLVPGSCKEFSSQNNNLPAVPSNNINVIGTSGQPVLCLEGR